MIWQTAVVGLFILLTIASIILNIVFWNERLGWKDIKKNEKLAKVIYIFAKVWLFLVIGGLFLLVSNEIAKSIFGGI